MSDYRFGVDDYGLNYYPHDGVHDEQECIDWSKVERVEIDWVDFVRERTCKFTIEDNMNETEGMGDVWIECSACHCVFDFYADEWLMKMSYCPNCGAKVIA